MPDHPYLDELLRRLPGASMTDNGVTWHEPGAGTVRLVVTEDDLARLVQDTDEDTRDALWPDATLEAAGFNLLLVHLMEIVETRGVDEPLRITADGLVWPEAPAWEAPDLPDGGGPYVWEAARPEEDG